ncbi:MAG TPA: DUF4384 domain-containing protein [Gemmatimonadales bacterium]|jgi:hypothetical protein|nr:DUF4384 domain-containing protein [Gemmatimonadales bacterium]
MLVALGWLLLAAGPPAPWSFHPAPVIRRTAGRVALWTGRDEPYRRGEEAKVFLILDEPAYVAVFRVDTDGRIRVLFPRQPWTDSYVPERRELEVTGARGGRAFLVDDDPGVGYLFALASAEPLDFRGITRGDYWDYRLIDGGRIQGDPYVRLTDLAARLAPDGDYDYDVVPYYVDHRYDYPRFVCYDCHAYAGYSEWDPYRAPCSRYRVVIRDDPRYYPYRYGGRNVVAQRPAHPGPRYVIRDADPRRPWVTHGEPDRRRADEAGDLGRTSEDVGGRGSVPVPARQSFRRRDHEASPELSPADQPPSQAAPDDAAPEDGVSDEAPGRSPRPSRPPAPRTEGRAPAAGALRPPADPGRPNRTEPGPMANPRPRGTDRDRVPPGDQDRVLPGDRARDDGRDSARETPEGLRPSRAPRSTGEPELRRRRP